MLSVGEIDLMTLDPTIAVFHDASFLDLETNLRKYPDEHAGTLPPVIITQNGSQATITSSRSPFAST